MNRLKRILALTLCMLLAITSLPVTQLVFAADKVVFDDNTLTSVNDIVWAYRNGGKDYIEPSLDANGNLVVTQIATSGAGTNTFPAVARSLDNIVVEESAENGTVVVAKGLNGKYTYEIDLEAWIKRNPDASSAGYATLYFDTGSGSAISIRVAGGAITIYDGDSASSCAYVRSRAGKGVWQAEESPATTTLKITLDTTTGKIESYFKGALMDKNNGKLQEDDSTIAAKFHNKPIKSLSYSFLSRNDAGTYLKFNDFKITQHSNAAESILSALPAKLDVENINNVTETSVTLDEVAGVTWASADETTATVSGNTLTLIPSEEGTKEAKVTATFTHNGIEYVKTYTMTLAKVEENVEPEPPVDPQPPVEPEEPTDDGVVLVDKVFNYADVAAAKADGWKMDDNNYAEIAVENGFVKYNQIGQCALYKASGSAYAANDGGNSKPLMFMLPKGVVAVDEENGTEIINNSGKYMGKLKLEFEVEMDMKPADKFYLTEDGKETGTPLKDGDKDIVDANGKAIQVRQPQFNISFAPNLGVYRLRPSSQKLLNNNTEGNSTVTNNANNADFKKGNTHKFVMTFDTVGRKITGTIEGQPNVATGDASIGSDGALIKGKDYFSQVQVGGFERMAPGSNFTFKSIKFATEEASYGPEGNAIVEELPAKLINGDVKNVTELSATLPEIAGVTWKSLDESAAVINGNTVTFIPSTDDTKVAKISADFTGETANSIKFSKVYTMTLAKGEAPVIPEPPVDPQPPVDDEEDDIIPDPDNNVPDWVEVFGTKKAPGILVDSHGFEDSDVPGRKVYNGYSASTNYSGKYTADGFVLNRETSFASGTGGKLSNELMRINFTQKVENEYKYGLEGMYVIDLTVNGMLTSTMSKSDVYFKGYMVSDGPDSLSTDNHNNVNLQFIAELGKTGNTFFTASSVADSALTTERALIPVDTDTIVRLVVDSSTGNLAVYTSTDNKATFNFHGALDSVIKGNSMKGVVFNPGLGLVPKSTMTFKNIDIYKIPLKYKVSFYDMDGEFYHSESVYEGTKAPSISGPDETNYIFKGWYEEGADSAYDFDTAITGEVKLYAKYEGAPSNVVFQADGNTIATLTGKFGGTVEGVIPDVPEKPGYTAVGWVVGDTDEVFTTETPINSTNMIVKAKYVAGTINSYTVTFIADGEEYFKTSAAEGYAISNVPDAPVKDNYTFKGWLLENEPFDFSTPITSDITLVASFEAKDMNVKFYMDEQLKEVFKTEVVKYGSSVTKLPVPSKSTYKFLGWKNVDGTDFTTEQIIEKDTNVYAVWESLVKVILDEDTTKYTSLTGNNVEFSQSGAATALSLDNGGKMTWVKEMPTSRTFDNNLIVKFKVPVGDEDTVNRTQVYNNKLVGDYEVEVTADVKLADVSWNSAVTANPYGYYSTGYVAGTGFNNILVNRLTSSSIQTYNNNASASSDFNATNTMGKQTSYSHSKTSSGKLADGGFENVVNRLRFDSTKNYAEMTAPGYTEKAYGRGMNSVAGINGVRFSMMACFAPGDYIRVKNIKVTQYSFDFSDADYLEAMDIIGKLPATIVAEGDRPDAVTKDLVIPAVKGVVWTSSDKNVANSSTGAITKWYDSQDVVITALVNVGDHSYSKEYKLTIAGEESVIKETVFDDSFTSAADMDNWTFASLADGVIADYSVDANGVKISKVTAPEISDSKYENKRFFAYYDLYSEANADTYTTTSTKDVKGVYDVSLKLGDYSATSTVPMNIGVGYRNGTTFYPYGSIVYDADGAKFIYNYDTETVREVELGEVKADSVVTIRVDNVLGEVSLIMDGRTVSRDASVLLTADDAMLNTVRVALDVNNEIGDYVSIKGVKLDKVIKNNIPQLSSVRSAADSLTISTVTSNPDAVSGTINSLPSTVGKYKVDWTSSSNQIDVETRKVYHDKTANVVTLTAEVYDATAQFPVVVRKTFKITVRAAENAAELGQFQISQLGRITSQNYNDIRYDLVLPNAEGVEWKSSNTDIIGNDGKINDTVVLTKATPVTMTATSGGITATYDLMVAPRTAQVDLSSGSLPLSIKLTNAENAKISSDVRASFTYTHSAANTGKVNVLSDNGDVLASMVATATGIYFDYKNSNYKEIALAEGETVNVEFVVMPDVDKVAVLVNDNVVVDYASFKVNADYVAKVDATNSVLNTGSVKLTADKYGMLKANIDNFNYFEDANFGYANLDGIKLPDDVVSNGTVTWTSSNPSVLGNDGKVTAVDKLTKVNLTFTITDNEDSSIFISKDFEIVVDCNEDDNIIGGIVPVISNLKDHLYPEVNATDNDIRTAMKLKNANKADSEIVFNLGEAKAFNSMYISNIAGGIEDFAIYASNDNVEWKEVYSGNFGSGKSAFVAFNAVNGAYIKLVVKQNDTKDILVDEIKVFLSATKYELAEMDIESLVIPATAEGSKINLPTKGTNGTVFTWTSSDESVIDKDGNVTRPSSATTVTLTVKAVVDGKELTKSFPVYVDTKSTSGPTQVGGGAGGSGGGGGGASAGAASKPVIGTTEDTVFGEEVKPEVTEPTTPKATYSDVKTTDWYYNAVTKLTEKGVIAGDGTGKFNPSDKVTREQFVKMILEAIEVEVAEADHSFADVTKGAWYEGYVATAVSKGIVNGIGDGKFGIGSNISRQDMAVLIERVLAYKEIEIEKAEVEAFADASEVAGYAKDAVANMKAIGLIQGYNNKYNPKDNLTRAEAATVISTLLELLAK